MTVLNPSDVWHLWLSSGHHDLKAETVPSSYEPGRVPNLMVITGENGGGKSLAVEVLRQVSNEMAKEGGRRLEVMDIGMKRRLEPGMERAFIFGQEKNESTGHVSIRTALSGIRNSREREHDHWLILDEPDIGVGEGYQRALGEYLADFGSNLPASCSGFVVISHSRAVIGAMIEAGACSLRVGRDLRPIRDWLANGDLHKTVDDLLALKENISETRTRVRALFDLLREERNNAPAAVRSPGPSV